MEGENSLKPTIDLINSYVNKDAFYPDLSQRLGVSNHKHPSVSGLQGNDYPSLHDMFPTPSSLPIVSPMKHVPLPHELTQQFGDVQYNCMMGMFPGVQRAWLAVDSDLYVWNYEDGSDVAYFDGLADTIVSVSLVLPKHGVFQPSITHLLVLTTPVDIVILGVSFNLFDGVNEMHLLPDPLFSIPTDNTYIYGVAGTANGRIFMTGRDGCLYEIAYSAKQGWFSGKCSKVNHTKGKLSYILPTFINSAMYDDDPLVQISIDDSRNLMYTRSEQGSIELIDLGADGSGFNRVAKIYASALVHAAISVCKRNLDGSLFKPVTIIPIPQSDSLNIHLIVVTVSGIRLYFSTRSFNTTTRPEFLTLVHVRFPPTTSSFGGTGHAKPSGVHSVCCVGGALAMAATGATEADTLWIAHGDPFTNGGETANYAEVVCPLEVPSRVWMIAGLPGNPDTRSYQPNALALHNANPNPQFLLITAQGSFTFSKLKPADQLRHILIRNGGPDNSDVLSFFKLYSPTEACYTSLVLACDCAASDARVAQWAVTAFFLYGGEPSIPLHVNPSPSSPVSFSHRHSSSSLYVSRLLLPVWSSPMLRELRTDSHSGTPDLVASATSVDVWAAVHRCLRSFLLFLDEHCNFSFNRGDAYKISPKLAATNRERQSLLNLKNFIEEVVQLIGLWEVFYVNDIHNIVNGINKINYKNLVALDFKGFVTSARQFVPNLIESLINGFIKEGLPTEQIVGVLQGASPSYFNKDDAIITEATETLQGAILLPDSVERTRRLARSLALYNEAAGSVNLEAVAVQFLRARFLEGIVALSVRVATVRDPKGFAVLFYRTASERPDRRELFASRCAAYLPLTDTLDQLSRCSLPESPNFLPQPVATEYFDRLVKLSFSTSDELLHYVVLEWLLSHSFLDKLLDIDSPYMEAFLSRSLELQPDCLELIDLLWRYEEKLGNFDKAARILERLAERRDSGMRLGQRVEYLTQAAVAARCPSATAGSEATDFLQEVEEKLQVARVQQLVLDTVDRLGGLEEVRRRLDSELVDISTLYSDYAERFELFECQLAILHCAGHYDRELVHSLWPSIIAAEFDKCRGQPPESVVAAVQSKVVQLGSQYAASERFFPLSVILSQLEKRSHDRGIASTSWVADTMAKVGVHALRLLRTYSQLHGNADPYWLEHQPYHYLHVVVTIISDFLKVAVRWRPDENVLERRGTVNLCLDMITGFFLELQANVRGDAETPDTLIAEFRLIHSQLETLNR